MRKGRNKNLILLRDEKLIQRYYYWTEVRRLRFDDTLQVLSEREFFISKDRIMSIIRKNYSKLSDIPTKPSRVRMPRVKKEHLSLFSGE